MSTSKTGADVVVEGLADLGIDVCFANPGTTEMWLVKSLATSARIRSVLALHETVCSGASDGYARMRRRPALCLLHMGPGLANALSNLHNAKRARSPVVVVVGDMATWHATSDAPLCMDIRGLALTVSGAVTAPTSLAEVLSATRKCFEGAVLYGEDPLGSRVSTLVLPHDLSWTEAATVQTPPPAPPPAVETLSSQTQSFLDKCIEALRETPSGKVAFLAAGLAVLADDDAVVMLGKVSAKLGAALYCENAFARIDRGYGRPHLRRLPYFPEDALRELAPYEVVVTLDCRLPVAQFGYRNGPSALLHLDDAHLWQIDAGIATPAVIRYLFVRLDASTIQPEKNCRGLFPPLARPVAVEGRLSAASLCSVVAELQPEDVIVVDESITSGGQYWELSKGCPPFTHLTLTGGAIGCGPALAVGAAVAARDRLVINLQADGSAMYAAQAFWTQAKEALNVVTVICSNRSYAILKLEVAKQGIRALAGAQLSQLTDLSDPAIDWTALAAALGIRAAKASTVQELRQHLNSALESRRGPFLIEAIL